MNRKKKKVDRKEFEKTWRKITASWNVCECCRRKSPTVGDNGFCMVCAMRPRADDFDVIVR